MAVIEGQTLGPGESFPDGTIFINCTIKSPCTFGNGCVFENCSLVRDYSSHSVGEGAVMHGGFVEYTNFGDGAETQGTSIGAAVSFGAGSKQDGPALLQSGGAIDYESVNPGQGQITLDKNWRCDWSCKPPYINKNIIGNTNAPVIVVDAGITYTLPATST